MPTSKLHPHSHRIHLTLSLSKILGYIILYAGSLILLSKIFLAIL